MEVWYHTPGGHELSILGDDGHHYVVRYASENWWEAIQQVIAWKFRQAIDAARALVIVELIKRLEGLA